MTATTLNTHVAVPKSVETTASPWHTLYTTGAVAAVALVVLTAIQAAVFIAWPPPAFEPSAAAVGDWFSMLHDNWLIGLLNLDLLMLVDYPASLLVLVALCVAIRDGSRSLATMGLALGVTGIASYFSIHPAFSMLGLAEQYAAATTDAHRTMLLSAGQAILAAFEGSAFITSYILIAVSGLLVAIAMLQGTTFGRRTAFMGIAFYGMNLVPASAGTLGLVLSLASLIPMVIWLVLVARRLLQLARQEGA